MISLPDITHLNFSTYTHRLLTSGVEHQSAHFTITSFTCQHRLIYCIQILNFHRPYYHKNWRHPHTQILTTSLISSHTQSTVPAHRDLADMHASLTAPTDDCSLLNQQRQRQGLFLWWLGGLTTTSLLHTYDLRQAYTASNENCLKKELHKAKEGVSRWVLVYFSVYCHNMNSGRS